MKKIFMALWGKLNLSPILLSLSITAIFPFCAKSEVQLSKIKLPPNFQIEIYNQDAAGARSLARGDQGAIFVGTRAEGKVYALKDEDGDNKAERFYVVARGLNSPNGVAFRGGDLYVAEISRVLKFENIENRLNHPPKAIVVWATFPREGHHGWKFIAFGPEGRLYVSIGAPCNICLSQDARFASLTRMKPDGSEFEIYAKGIRNTVGFDWHPKTKELWFTDNGRDWLGDNQPPDELNRAFKKGLHFGYPYCHGKNIADPEFGEKRSCSDIIAPVQELGPHVAALGMRFYTGDMFPEKYRNQIFMAEHGSWNRSRPIGYRITLVTLEKNKATGYEVFAEGWLQGQNYWGRPVDILIMPDGALLVSDDYAGVVYRIAR